MQHDMALPWQDMQLTCPACQSTIPVQLALQHHEKQQQQKRHRQLSESQTTLLKAKEYLEQGGKADDQGDYEKAFRLYRVGSAGAIVALKQWPEVTNPIAPMIDQIRSRVKRAMERSEQISKLLAAWAQVTDHPLPMAIQAFKVGFYQPAEDFDPDAAPSSGPRQLSESPQLPQQVAQQPQQVAQQQAQQVAQQQAQQQVAQQQAQQPQQVAEQQAQQHVAQQPQQQRRQPVVVDLVALALQQKKQKEEEAKEKQQRPKVEDQGLVALRTPRAPLGPPPQMLLDSIGLRSKAVSKDVLPKAMPKAAKSKAVSKLLPVGHVEDHCGCDRIGCKLERGVAPKKQRVEMPEQEKEEHEDASAWDFLTY